MGPFHCCVEWKTRHPTHKVTAVEHKRAHSIFKLCLRVPIAGIFIKISSPSASGWAVKALLRPPCTFGAAPREPESCEMKEEAVCWNSACAFWDHAVLLRCCVLRSSSTPLAELKNPSLSRSHSPSLCVSARQQTLHVYGPICVALCCFLGSFALSLSLAKSKWLRRNPSVAP